VSSPACSQIVSVRSFSDVSIEMFPEIIRANYEVHEWRYVTAPSYVAPDEAVGGPFGRVADDFCRWLLDKIIELRRSTNTRP
jgi:hypothetical protein